MACFNKAMGLHCIYKSTFKLNYFVITQVMTASKHPPRPLVVALIWLINTAQLIGLVETSHLGYFFVSVRVK